MKLKEGNNVWLPHVCGLINALQITLSQIRLMEYLKNELKTEYAIQEGKDNELAEMMHYGVGLYTDQTYDLALLNKRQLVLQINKILAGQDLTSNHLLEEDRRDVYRINVTGQLETKIVFETVETYDKIPDQYRNSSPDEGVCLWLALRGYGELLVDKTEMSQQFGEVYIGTGILSRIYWPFLIDLDGTCIAVNGAMAGVVEVDCSEK